MQSTLRPTAIWGLARGMGLCVLSLTSGCFSPWFRPDNEPDSRRQAIRAKLESEERPRIISEIGFERTLTMSRLENVGLITSLPGTGGIVRASQPREKMLNIMRLQDTDQPNTLLDANSTAMVVAFIAVPPAARKGKILDVVVKLSSHSEASNLQGGWLLKTSLVEMQSQAGKVREGFEFASGEGALVTQAQISGSDTLESKTNGIIVGGARLLKQRELGIGISTEFADAITMKAIVPAINRRFTVFDGRKQVGIATPASDSSIVLVIPTKYELDPFHFINVVLNISFNESEVQKAERIATLRKQLEDPITVRTACWQLEALGEEALPILQEQLSHPNPEIRFYVAHSMAYLDDKRSIEALTQLSQSEPAFRAMCLNALAVIDCYEAAEALEGLFHVADAETRYGAVRSLRYRDASDPRVTGQAIGTVGSILEVPSAGPPLVAISLQERPEVVIFGSNPLLKLPVFHYVNPRILLQANANNLVTISHFEKGQDDRVVQVPNDLRNVLQGISDVGGNYGDWVSFLRECSQQAYLSEPLAINPIPSAGRTYSRETRFDLEPGEHLYEDTIIDAIDVPEGSKSRAWYNPFAW